ncbi:MAG TPA: hypothetical protein VM008_01105 [Phycisphaerae bacterium]|nr:hypothetical protein [Phycisphaerae bacterium]
MKVPLHPMAIVPDEKLRAYLLDSNHAVGGPKAVFFRRLGFTPDRLQDFAEALRKHINACEVSEVTTMPFGVVYAVEGPVETPAGKSTRVVRSVWIVESEGSPPRLVTAYPID